MSGGYRAADQPLVRLSFRGRLLLAAAILGTLLLATGGAALGAALGGGQVTCAAGADLLVHPDGTWTCAQPAPSGSPTPAPSATQTPSPSPSPTVQPTPSASPTATTPPATTPPATTPPPGPLTNCLAAPAKCGLPDASSTGPSGTLAVTTKTVYSTAGQVITNTQINGCVEVRASNVVFRNVLFTGSCFWTVRVYSGSVTIQDSEISCRGNPGSSGFVNTSTSSGGTAALVRVDIHDCENGLSSGVGNVALIDSWVHDLVTCCGAHTDGMQIDQGAANIIVRHNTITVPAPGGNSAIISWDESGTQQQNVVIDGNLLSGGTYTLYCPRQGTSSTSVTNNRFGIFEFGSSDSCIGTHVSAWSGNVVDSTGKALVAA